MRKRFGPSPSFVRPAAPAQGSPGMKLTVKETYPSLHLSPPLPEKRLFFRRILHLPVRSRRGGHGDTLFRKLLPLLGPRPVGVVSEEMSPEDRFQQAIQSLTVVTVSRHLKNESDAAARREYEMFPNPVKPAFQGSAVSAPNKSGQTLLLPGSHRTTDIYGVGVDNEKGGSPSPSSVQNARERCCISGVRIARRSAQFWRERRRGKSDRMVSFDSNQR